MQFNKIKLKDIADINMGQSPSGSSYNNNGRGIPFLQGNKTFGFLYPTIDTWTTEPKKIGKKNSVLMSVRAPVGDLNIANKDICIGRGLCSIEMKNGNNQYLYYLLKNSIKKIKMKSTGTVFDSINRKELENIEILDFDKSQQKKISKVLFDIDKKIELNIQTNDNLLELIKKLYIEKIKNNNDINFEEKNLDEFCNIFTGKKNANASEENGQYKFFTCAPEPLSINSYIYDGPAVIIAGNGAYTGRTNFYNGKFDLYQRTYGITTNNDYIYLFYAMIYTDLQNDIMGGTHGSAIPYIVMNDIAKFKVKYNKELFDELSQKIKVLLLKIKINEAQNETLEQLRETLLPKLMNGEIDLDKIKI